MPPIQICIIVFIHWIPKTTKSVRFWRENCSIIPPMKHVYFLKTYRASDFLAQQISCFHTVICFEINNICSQRRQTRNHIERDYPLKTFQFFRSISTLHSYAMSFPLHSFYYVLSYFFLVFLVEHELQCSLLKWVNEVCKFSSTALQCER